MPVTELTRIVYADDEPDISMIALFALEKIGKFTVLGCQSGQEVLDRAGEFAPDLILLDVMMPELDGPETLRRLRETHVCAGVPVFFVTAKSQPAEIAQLKAAGADDVIVKPFDPMTISDELRRLWRGLGRAG